MPPGPLLPSLPDSASKGLGAGLPLLPLAVAPPGDGVKAAGLTKRLLVGQRGAAEALDTLRSDMGVSGNLE